MTTNHDGSDDQHFYSSFVVEYIVPVGQERRFNQWYGRLVDAARQFEGYTRTDLCPPLDCGDGVVKWYYIVHFSTPENLKRWLKSDLREQLLEEGQDTFLAYRYKSFTTGLEGWFSNQFGGDGERKSLGPPPWKQVFSVVLGLYPTLMVQGIMFGALGIMATWPLPTSMVVNNLITSSLLTWLVMPMVTRLLSFWLYPAYRMSQGRKDAIGAGIVIIALVFLVSFFNMVQMRWDLP
jgi:antibiotic biosynthesis monooxygenase (ABM) superfamily enzyme